jgi:ketoreductase RED2
VELTGKVAIVTGSTSGIGQGLAVALAEAGACVVINSVHSVAAGERIAAELPDAMYVQADVSDRGAAHDLVAATVERWGRVDILVNNAGGTKPIDHAMLDAVDEDVWQQMLAVNLLGPWWMVQAAAPRLRAHGEGVVLNVSSLAGVRPRGSSIPYSVSKAALNHMTELLAGCLGPEIRVNALAPGFIETKLTEHLTEFREEWKARAPLARPGVVSETTEAGLFLIRSTYTTGVVLVVDGGLQLR